MSTTTEPAEVGDPLARIRAAVGQLVAEADELHPNDLRLLANRAVAIMFPGVEEDPLGELLEREEKRAKRDRFLAFGRNPSGSVTFKGQLSPVDGEKFITLITAYAQQLKNQHAHAEDRLDPRAETPTTARHLACAADLIPVVLDTQGVVLDVGRTRRLFTRGIRHGLEVRDQGCVLPRCEAPPQQCEAHHLTPWHLGGETALHNGALLCPHHHKIVEPDPNAPKGSRWTIALDHRGFPHVFPPTRVDPERRPRQHTRFRQRGHPDRQ